MIFIKNLLDDFEKEVLFFNLHDDFENRVRNIVLQLHDAIRDTNIFDETVTDPKNKVQLKQFLTNIFGNGNRNIFYNMTSDDNENEYLLLLQISMSP